MMKLIIRQGVSHTAISNLGLAASGSLHVYHRYVPRFAVCRSKSSSDSGSFDDLGISDMHVSWKSAILAIQTHARASAATLSSNRERTTMSVDALDIVTLGTFLAWGLACDDT